MDYMNEVHKFVVTHFLFGDSDKLNEDTSFLEAGIVDSTGILELVNFLEVKYNITIDDNELTPENLDNLKNISAFIERKILCVE